MESDKTNFFIKGDKKRGAEVIALLESKGGVNTGGLWGNAKNRIYYIDKNKDIRVTYAECAESILETVYDELTLPDIWEPMFHVGDRVEFVQTDGTIISEGVVDGIDDYNKHTYVVRDTINNKQCIWTEEKMVLYNWKPQRGESVLVRQGSEMWKEGVFSFMDENGYFYTVGGHRWNCCEPFDINKLGKS